LAPKNEWDIAAEVALVEGAGGFARKIEPIRFNRNPPVFLGSYPVAPYLLEEP